MSGLKDGVSERIQSEHRMRCEHVMSEGLKGAVSNCRGFRHESHAFNRSGVKATVSKRMRCEQVWRPAVSNCAH